MGGGGGAGDVFPPCIMSAHRFQVWNSSGVGASSLPPPGDWGVISVACVVPVPCYSANRKPGLSSVQGAGEVPREGFSRNQVFSGIVTSYHIL